MLYSGDANESFYPMLPRTHRLFLSVLLMSTAPACTDRALPEDWRSYLKELCVDYCPRRIECVEDEWADKDVAECVEVCSAGSLHERGRECRELLIAGLECLAELPCEELPAATKVSERNGNDYPCSEYHEAVPSVCAPND